MDRSVQTSGHGRVVELERLNAISAYPVSICNPTSGGVEMNGSFPMCYYSYVRSRGRHCMQAPSGGTRAASHASCIHVDYLLLVLTPNGMHACSRMNAMAVWTQRFTISPTLRILLPGASIHFSQCVDASISLHRS